MKLGIQIPEGEKRKEERGKWKEKKKEAKEIKGIKESKDKKPLEAEIVTGPIAQAPGNPSKLADTDDPHAGGSHDKQSTGTFTPHHHSSRGE